MRAISILPSDVLSGVHPGPAPMLQWLKIADLVIDDSYQRELRRTNWTAIRKIASAFTWSRFSPVFVAPVEGGKYAIIDGQHRTHAAAMCGFEDVPCQIVQMSAAEQADAFAAVNGMVTKITSLQIFKAALAAGSGWATELRDLAQKAGCEVRTSNGSSDAKRPGQIYAVSAFRVLAGRYGGGHRSGADRDDVSARLEGRCAVLGCEYLRTGAFGLLPTPESDHPRRLRRWLCGFRYLGRDRQGQGRKDSAHAGRATACFCPRSAGIPDHRLHFQALPGAARRCDASGQPRGHHGPHRQDERGVRK
ncbi:MAG: ParB N-terminal domain-containing protein [Afipia sp.]|nr:ParB N-terminal domain-containing protein [Afipia sp.]